jgi:hypothetical protein
VTGLGQAIRARLDATTERAYPEMQAMRDALLAVLDLHIKAEAGLFVAPGPLCQYCYGEIGGTDPEDGAWPCPTVRRIAEKLGIEHD